MSDLTVGGSNHNGLEQMLAGVEHMLTSAIGFREAEGLLRQAAAAAGSSDPDLRTYIDERISAVAERKISFLDSLLSDAQVRLTERPPKAQLALDLLDEALGLGPSEKQEQMLAGLRQLAQQELSRERERQLYNTTLAQMEAYWDREQEDVAAGVAPLEIIKECFDPPVALAAEAHQQYRTGYMSGLINRANEARNAAHARYDLLTTAEKTGDYAQMIADLEKIEDKKQLVPWGEQGGHLTVEQAITAAKKLAEEYAEGKADEYIQQADDALDDSPRSAKSLLEKALTLFNLNQETANAIQKRLEGLAVNLAALDRAEALLAEAELSSDARQGWGKLSQARKAFTRIDRATTVEQSLLARLLYIADQLLADSEQAISADPVKAEAEAAEAQRWANLVQSRSQEPQQASHAVNVARQAAALLSRAQTEHQLQRVIADQVAQIRHLLKDDIAAALAAWESVEASHDEATMARFPALMEARRLVESRADVEKLIARLESAFASNDIQRIVSALEDCQAAATEAANAAIRPSLLALQEKLTLRREYLIGVQELATTGNAEKALAHFDMVISQSNHLDASAATERAKQIRGDRAFEESITQTLSQAEADLAAGRPEAAYERLAKFAGQITLQRQALDKKLSQARQAWEAKLVAEIKADLEGHQPDPLRLRELARQLEKDLPGPCPMVSYSQALAAAASVEAAQLERDKKWREAVEKLDEALRYDLLNRGLRTRRRQARIRCAEQDLAQLRRRRDTQESEFLGLFEDLEQEIAEDVEVRLLRARHFADDAAKTPTDIARQQRLYTIAADALAAAVEAASRDSGATEQLMGAIDGLQSRVESAEKLLHRQRTVENRLQPKRGLIEFQQAATDGAKLVQEKPNNDGLQEWWAHCQQQTIEALVSAEVELDPNDRWGRFYLRCKILILNGEHEKAQQLLRDLPAIAQGARQRIEQAIADRNGVTIKTEHAANVAELQFNQTADIVDSARAAYNILVRFGDRIADPVAQGLAEGLRQEREQMQAFLNQLSSLRGLVATAQGHLRQAAITNDWHAFDQVIQMMAGLDFAGHRSREALMAEKEEIRQRRLRVVARLEALKLAIADEKLDEANRLMADLEQDPDDPDDTFNLRATVEVTVSHTGQTIRGWHRLRVWLGDSYNQLTRIATWLAWSGGTAGLGSDTSYVVSDASIPAGIVDWPAVLRSPDEDRGTDSPSTIAWLADRGRWPEAKDMARLALEGDQQHYPEGWLDPRQRLLALRVVFQRLEQPPLAAGQAQTNRVVHLLGAAAGLKKSLIPHIDEAEETLRRLRKDEDEWPGALAELNHSLRELRTARRSWFNRAKKVDRARQRVHAALGRCGQLAPNHPNLEGVLNLPELRV